MSLAFAVAGGTIRLPYLAVVLLSLSAIAGNVVQWQQKVDLETQAKENNDQAECRSRIVGYVEGLQITLDLALGTGILDRLGANDDAVFQSAAEAYAEGVRHLDSARRYREDAVEVCVADPNFDPKRDIEPPPPEEP